MIKIKTLYICLLAFITGCASQDPFEKPNRTIFSFNEKIDKYALKPLAQGYEKLTPKPIRTMVSNFYSNIEDAYSFANNIVQLKPRAAGEDLIRFSINTTFGIGGLIDIATAGGIPKHEEDLGQTLGYWGVPAGPYLILPFLGPSTIRDSAGKLGEASIGFSRLFDDEYAYLITYNAINLVQLRANLLDLSNNIDDVALDKYNFVKNAYLQKRNYDVLDGNVPEEDYIPLPNQDATQDESSNNISQTDAAAILPVKN